MAYFSMLILNLVFVRLALVFELLEFEIPIKFSRGKIVYTFEVPEARSHGYQGSWTREIES